MHTDQNLIKLLSPHSYHNHEFGENVDKHFDYALNADQTNAIIVIKSFICKGEGIGIEGHILGWVSEAVEEEPDIHLENRLQENDKSRIEGDYVPKVALWTTFLHKRVTKDHEWVEDRDEACIGDHTDDHGEVS